MGMLVSGGEPEGTLLVTTRKRMSQLVSAVDRVRVKLMRKVPLARELAYAPGEIVDFTPGIEVLVTPDIDISLDEQRLKAGFWNAFRRLGEWYDNIPPY